MKFEAMWKEFLGPRGKAKKRVGRGIGSGTGKTAGYGHKGQGARKGAKLGFEGGQTPLYRTMPKRGGYLGSKKKYSKTLSLSNVLVEEKLAKYGKNIDQSNSTQFINWLRDVFNIPFYYKNLKIIGGDLVKHFKIPGHSTLPQVNREARLAQSFYRNS